MRFGKRALFSILFVVVAGLADAEVIGIEIESRQDLLDGRSFGLAGPYEALRGTVNFAVDPKDPHNETIVDLEHAPLNADGLVEFSADIYILKPKDPNRGNGSILFDVVNRGNKVALGRFNHGSRSHNPMTDEDLGDGFLMNQGFTVLWVGWQFDVRARGGGGAMTLSSPTVDVEDGLVRYWFRPTERSLDYVLPTRGAVPYGVSERGAENQLTARQDLLDERRTIPRDSWQFEVAPESISIRLDSGFVPGMMYEVVYRATGARVPGLGFAAVRDAVSFLRYESDLLGAVDYGYAFGASQSGRFLRGYLYNGFNADTDGRRVFDGMIPIIAGAVRSGFNRRYVQPSVTEPARFPFSDGEQAEMVTGKRDGLLQRASRDGALPKIMYLNTSNEYWTAWKAAALVHTSVDGKRDLELMDTVRLYTVAGTQHGPGPFPPGPARTAAQHLANPNDYTWVVRSLLMALDRWVRAGENPPPSRYPTLAERTLVSFADLEFPSIPGVPLPKEVVGTYRYDDGRRFEDGIAAVVPPRLREPYPMFVPQVDEDGNEIGGVRLPEVEVPVATYTGWNLRHASIGAPEEPVRLTGSYLPFPTTKAERQTSGDPRLSLEERYTSKAHYLGLVTEAALRLVEQRLLLDGDVVAILEHASAHWDYAVGASGN